MDEIMTCLVNLPLTINGYTVRDKDGDYNIYLNSRLTYERQLEAYKHELHHIQEGDFNSTSSLDLIEIHAHKEGG